MRKILTVFIVSGLLSIASTAFASSFAYQCTGNGYKAHIYANGSMTVNTPQSQKLYVKKLMYMNMSNIAYKGFSDNGTYIILTLGAYPDKPSQQGNMEINGIDGFFETKLNCIRGNQARP